MQTSPNVYRLSGLLAVLGLLALVVGLIVLLVLPSIRYVAWGLLVLGILLLAIAFIVDFRRVGRALTGRRGRFSTGTTVMASVFIGIVLLVNAISIGNYHRFDLTGVAQFTLTSQTKEVLSQLETPVQVLCFFVPDDPYGIASYTTSLLTEYQNYTDQLSLEYIDPEEHPEQARKYGIYGITVYPVVIFESLNWQRYVLAPEIVTQAEHAFTSAILEVTGIVQKKVYFLTGHGEASPDSNYSYARQGLLDNLYKVATLDLMFTPSIPEDCAALIIAAPRKSLTSGEVKIIEDYLESDGWVMILTNPDSPPEIRQLLSAWGVEIEDGIVVDPSSYVAPNLDSPIVPRIRNLWGLSEVYFPGATAIIPQPGYVPLPVEEGGMVQIIWASEDSQTMLNSLVRTSQDSWLENDFDPGEKPEFNEGIDREGPLNIGFLIVTIPVDEAQEESPEAYKGTRLVVIGDSDFASNEHFYNGSNGDLFLNSVHFLTAEKELISIERKVLPFRKLIVGPEAENFINISSVALLPLLVLAIGGVIWWRRR